MKICPTAGEAASGPLAGGDGPADFGTIPEACLASDVTLRARGALLVAASKPDFFGSILAGAMLRARRPIGTKSWLTLALDVVDFRYINNGGLAATGLSFGPATLGYNRTVYATDGSTTAGYARLLLPIDTARQNGFETGLEVGGVVRARLGGRAIADGGVGLTAPLDVTGGQLHGRLEPILLAELSGFALRPGAALGAGASATVELAPEAKLVTAVPRVSARFALARRFWTAVLLELPRCRHRPDGLHRQPVRRPLPLSFLHLLGTRSCARRGSIYSAPRHGQDQDEVEQQREEALQADGEGARQEEAGVPAPQPRREDHRAPNASCATGLRQQDPGASDQGDAPVRLT